MSFLSWSLSPPAPSVYLLLSLKFLTTSLIIVLYIYVCVYVCNVCVYTYTLLSPFSVIPVHMSLGLTIWDLINLSGGLCLEKTDSLTLNSH